MVICTFKIWFSLHAKIRIDRTVCGKQAAVRIEEDIYMSGDSTDIALYVPSVSLSTYLCDRWPGLQTKVAHVGLAVCR